MDFETFDTAHENRRRMLWNELQAELAETRADLEWYVAHRCIGYKDRISFAVKPYSTFCLRKEVEHDGTPEDLRRVIRAARKGE